MGHRANQAFQDHVLPDLIKGDGFLDIHLPLRMSPEDGLFWDGFWDHQLLLWDAMDWQSQEWSATGGGALINPSLTLLDDSRLILAARLHRHNSKFQEAAVDGSGQIFSPFSGGPIAPQPSRTELSWRSSHRLNVGSSAFPTSAVSARSIGFC